MKCKSSRLSPAHKPRWTLPAAMASVLLLGGCVTAPKPVVIQVPDSLRKPCERAPVGALATQGDLDALIIRQEVAVATCSKRGDALVEIIDSHAEVTKPRKWFEIWR